MRSLYELRRGKRVDVPNPLVLGIAVTRIDDSGRRVTNFGDQPIKVEGGGVIPSLASLEAQPGVKLWRGNSTLVVL